MEEITIIGAGLVGSLLAVILQQRGFAVTVYERYQDIRHIPQEGRSINLVLTSRGLRPVAMIGTALRDEMLRLAKPVAGRIMHQENGTIDWQPYGKDDSECNYSISRFELNKFLMSKAEQAGAKIVFDHTLTAADLSSGSLKFQNGAAVTTQRIIACDGGGSLVRRAMKEGGFADWSETWISHGYKEMQFPRHACSTMSTRGLHIWPRGSHFLMGLANLDGSFTGTIYLAHEGKDSFERLVTPAAVAEFLNREYGDAVPLLGGTDAAVEQFLANPVGRLGNVDLNHWCLDDKVLLLGDAAHALVPFFGQGTNCGFEDALTLASLVDDGRARQSPLDWSKVFSEFSRVRKPNADSIQKMALENFVEMQEKVGDPRFLLQKAVENNLEQRFPHKFRSRYAMVCYGGLGNVTYANAETLGDIQEEILQSLISAIDKAEDVDIARAEQLIDTRLVPLHRQLNVDLTTVSRDLRLPAKAKL